MARNNELSNAAYRRIGLISGYSSQQPLITKSLSDTPAHVQGTPGGPCAPLQVIEINIVGYGVIDDLTGQDKLSKFENREDLLDWLRVWLYKFRNREN